MELGVGVQRQHGRAEGDGGRGDASSLHTLFSASSIPSRSPAHRWHPSHLGKTFFPQLFLYNFLTDKSRNVPNPVKLTMQINICPPTYTFASAATICMTRPRLRCFISGKVPVRPGPLVSKPLSQSSSHKTCSPWMRCSVHRMIPAFRKEHLDVKEFRGPSQFP